MAPRPGVNDQTSARDHERPQWKIHSRNPACCAARRLSTCLRRFGVTWLASPRPLRVLRPTSNLRGRRYRPPNLEKSELKTVSRNLPRKTPPTPDRPRRPAGTRLTHLEWRARASERAPKNLGARALPLGDGSTASSRFADVARPERPALAGRPLQTRHHAAPPQEPHGILLVDRCWPNLSGLSLQWGEPLRPLHWVQLCASVPLRERSRRHDPGRYRQAQGQDVERVARWERHHRHDPAPARPAQKAGEPVPQQQQDHRHDPARDRPAQEAGVPASSPRVPDARRGARPPLGVAGISTTTRSTARSRSSFATSGSVPPSAATTSSRRAARKIAATSTTARRASRAPRPSTS